MKIIKDHLVPYTWGEKCKAWELLAHENLSIKEELMPRQTHEKKHLHHQSQQYFYILEGKADFYLNDKKFELKKGESIHVPPQVFHQIKNIQKENLKFLVCTWT